MESILARARVRGHLRGAMLESFTPLPRAFYEPSALDVASRLLGHWLIRRAGRSLCGGPIVEVEAYLRDDAACHAARGRTQRNGVMFGPPGHAYVYLIYGYHYCVNAVCCPPGVAEAVLIRAVEPEFGQKYMSGQRHAKREHLTNGPGKLCQAMNIDRSLDGTDLCAPDSTVVIARNPDVAAFLRSKGPIVTTTRIGITQAAALPLRFYLAGSDFVSRRAGNVKP